MTEELPAPGWDAIDAALATLYGAAVPAHVGYMPPAALSHNLQGCSAYDAGDHWHYVTYGLSELYEPRPEDDPAFSGWGFELTFRLRQRPHGQAAPQWPFAVLNAIANQVNGHGMLLEPGSRLDYRGPITGHPNLPGAPDTGLTVVAVTTDPRLGTIATPNGAVTFLQLVGVTAGEKAEMLVSSTSTVLGRLARDNELLVTDTDRA